MQEDLSERIRAMGRAHPDRKTGETTELIIDERASKRGSRTAPVLSTLSLASCGGCILSLLGDTDGFLDLFDNVSIGFSHMFTDAQSIPTSDILLVEGGVRTEEEVAFLREARANTHTLVAFGTCATHGGIPALSNLYSLRELLAEVYDSDTDTESFDEPLTPRESLGAVDEFVDVDWYLPGCPPPVARSLEVLAQLLDGEVPEPNRSIVCRECGRKIVPKVWPPEAIATLTLKVPDPDICLVSQGYFCLGSVTRDGCGAPCPRAGYPCSGCRTASQRIIMKHTLSAVDAVAELMAKRTKLSSELIKKTLVSTALFYHAFTVIVEPQRMKNPHKIL